MALVGDWKSIQEVRERMREGWREEKRKKGRKLLVLFWVTFLEHLHTCPRRGEKNQSGRASMGAPEALPVPTFSFLPLAVAWSPLSLPLRHDCGDWQSAVPLWSESRTSSFLWNPGLFPWGLQFQRCAGSTALVSFWGIYLLHPANTSGQPLGSYLSNNPGAIADDL